MLAFMLTFIALGDLRAQREKFFLGFFARSAKIFRTGHGHELLLKKLYFSSKSFKMAEIASQKQKLQKPRKNAIFHDFARAQIPIEFPIEKASFQLKKLQNGPNRLPASPWPPRGQPEAEKKKK